MKQTPCAEGCGTLVSYMLVDNHPDDPRRCAPCLIGVRNRVEAIARPLTALALFSIVSRWDRP